MLNGFPHPGGKTGRTRKPPPVIPDGPSKQAVQQKGLLIECFTEKSWVCSQGFIVCTCIPILYDSFFSCFKKSPYSYADKSNTSDIMQMLFAYVLGNNATSQNANT